MTTLETIFLSTTVFLFMYGWYVNFKKIRLLEQVKDLEKKLSLLEASKERVYKNLQEADKAIKRLDYLLGESMPLDLSGPRASGRTTRLAAYYIDQLFRHGTVTVIDHINEFGPNNRLIELIQRRVRAEHELNIVVNRNQVSLKTIYNTQKLDKRIAPLKDFVEETIKNSNHGKSKKRNRRTPGAFGRKPNKPNSNGNGNGEQREFRISAGSPEGREQFGEGIREQIERDGGTIYPPPIGKLIEGYSGIGTDAT